MTEQILKLAPHPPRVSAYTSTSIVAECHDPAIDPNVALVTSRSDEEREAKKNSLPGHFIKGRLAGLEKLVAAKKPVLTSPGTLPRRLASKRNSSRQSSTTPAPSTPFTRLTSMFVPSLAFSLTPRRRRPARRTTLRLKSSGKLSVTTSAVT